MVVVDLGYDAADVITIITPARSVLRVLEPLRQDIADIDLLIDDYDRSTSQNRAPSGTARFRRSKERLGATVGLG